MAAPERLSGPADAAALSGMIAVGGILVQMLRRDRPGNASPAPAFRRAQSTKGKIDIAEAAFDPDSSTPIDDAQIVEAATTLPGSMAAAAHAAPAPALVVSADSQLHLDRRQGARADC
jgi:hypothetical protein